MSTRVVVQWDASKSMGASPRRVLLPHDVFVAQEEVGKSAVLVHGLHHAHYVFCHATQSRLRGIVSVNARTNRQRACQLKTHLHFAGDVSPDSTADEQQRVLRLAIESLQFEIIQWAMLLFSRSSRLTCSLLDVETAFPLLRALPFAARVDAMESAVHRYGCGLVLWRDNNLVSVALSPPLVALRHPTVNRRRTLRAGALSAATIGSLTDTPLSELAYHVNHLHRRMQRWLMDDPRHTFAASSTLGVALVIALQVVSPFSEFPNMCPSVRACLSGNLYAVYAAGAFRSGSDVRHYVGHVMRKKSLKSAEFVPVLELLLAGALTPRTTSLPVLADVQWDAAAGRDDGGASTFFSSQYETQTSVAPAPTELRAAEDSRHLGAVLLLDTLSCTTLTRAETEAVLASATKIPCLSPQQHTGTLGHVNTLAPFAKPGNSDWLQLTVDSALLKRGPEARTDGS